MSFINKAFLIARWKQDMDASIALLKKATEIDPMCELAYAHLGQLYIQTSKLDLAIEAYMKGSSLGNCVVVTVVLVCFCFASTAVSRLFIYPVASDFHMLQEIHSGRISFFCCSNPHLGQIGNSLKHHPLPFFSFFFAFCFLFFVFFFLSHPSSVSSLTLFYCCLLLLFFFYN